MTGQRNPTDDILVAVVVPRNVLLFFADTVGGSGPDTWGRVADHYGITVDDAHNWYEALTAVANEVRCVSCNGDLTQQGNAWIHLGTPGCDALIVPEGLQNEPTTTPAYPAPGSEIPGMPGYVVGTCEHRVAASEWRAGFRTCERCNFSGQDGHQ